MIYHLSKPIRRLLAVALLVLAVAIFWGLVVSPLRARLADLDDRIEQERGILGRLSAIASDQAGARELDRRTKAALASGLFLDGESEAIKLASLQSRLSEIIAANGTKLRSARNLPPRERNDVRLLGVQLQLSAPIEQLQKILLTIEEQKPLMLIDSLQITPLAFSNEEERGMLDARMDVFGVESRRKGG